MTYVKHNHPLWTSDNGKWVLCSTFHDRRPVTSALIERRKDGTEKHHRVRRQWCAIGCDAPGELPNYVIEAMYGNIESIGR